ncbi:retrovirus-related pol polyprotein from transposon TNT 1-94 [Tanacetum coccineum]|uniref:Retrovirus-related pol polyprotein from transposon TNT 1-94 n=1 Tax=Tanacetum coccineum TaxID=301880 RepID=A0ABQ5FNR1_9ASTR
MKVEESLKVKFDESSPPTKLSPLVDDDVSEEEVIERKVKVDNNVENESIEVDEVVNIKESKSHPLEQVIRNLNQRTLRSKAYIILNKHTMKVEESLNVTFDESPHPTKLSPLVDDDIGEEEAIERKVKVDNNVENESIEVDELDENGIESRNKARSVAQGYNQQEGIDYDETYAPVARLESIRILLALACANDFKLYQMDVKSDFLNGFINEEVYVAQPLGFIEKSNYVYNFKKALYGLKQAPKACQSKYIKEMLKKFGLEDSKPTKTPMSMEIKLTKDDEADSLDSTNY